MRLLEEEIIKYRQYHHHWASEKDENMDNQYSSVQLEDAEEKISSEFSSNNGN